MEHTSLVQPGAGHFVRSSKGEFTFASRGISCETCIGFYLSGNGCTIFPKCLRNHSERSFQRECFLNLKSFVIGEMFHFRILSRQDVNS